MENSYRIAFYGSSLVSAYWNGAATYYRGMIKALARLGNQVTFFEPDILDRQQHRDMPDPEWAKVVVYEAREERIQELLEASGDYDIVIKASGVGLHDEFLEKEILKHKKEGQIAIFWDVDAPATLARMEINPGDPFRDLVADYDLVFTYGGGNPVVIAYASFGVTKCFPIYNALDPETHFPVPPREEYQTDLAFLGNRLPDREARVEEFFFKTARLLPDKQFGIGGNGWQNKNMGPNIAYMGHVYTQDHNAFNCSPLAVLNINRESMAKTGFSPATRIFEAAGAAACIISDRWQGIDMFLEPGKEILLASSGEEVARHLKELDPERSRQIGEAALKRVLNEHTYAHRAKEVMKIFHEEALLQKIK